MHTVSILSENFDISKQLQLQDEIIAKVSSGFIMKKGKEEFLKYRRAHGLTFGVFEGDTLVGEAILYTKQIEEKAANQDINYYLWQ